MVHWRLWEAGTCSLLLNDRIAAKTANWERNEQRRQLLLGRISSREMIMGVSKVVRYTPGSDGIDRHAHLRIPPMCADSSHFLLGFSL